jgi:hypothetical protein
MIYSGDMQPDDDRYEWAHALGWHVPLALACAAISWLYPGAPCRLCDWMHEELAQLTEKTELLKDLAVAKTEDLISKDHFLDLFDKLLSDIQADSASLSGGARN